MKKGIAAWGLLLLMLTVPLFCAGAEEGIRLDGLAPFLAISQDGPMRVTLPDEPAISLEKNCDSYTMSWEPIEGVYEYRIGLFRVIRTATTDRYAELAGGWMGRNIVKDGDGKGYDVPEVITDAIVLDGGATEVDFAPQLNALRERPVGGGSIEGYYVLVTVVPQSGEPVSQLVVLPMA